MTQLGNFGAPHQPAIHRIERLGEPRRQIGDRVLIQALAVASASMRGWIAAFSASALCADLALLLAIDAADLAQHMGERRAAVDLLLREVGAAPERLAARR